MSLGVKLTLVVMSVILLGAALYTFTNIEKLSSSKKKQDQKQSN